MSGPTVYRHLPFLLKRAGTTSRAGALTRGLGRTVDLFGKDTARTLEAHYLGTAERDDLARIAAWFRLEPWADEDAKAFRRRIRTMAGVYRQGAVSAHRLLAVAAVAGDADGLAAPAPETETIATGPLGIHVLPPRSGPVAGWLEGQPLASTRFETTTVLTHRAAPDQPYVVTVEDMPPVTAGLTITPNAEGEYWWQVDNDFIGEPADDFTVPPSPERGCIPRFTITAGASDCHCPVLVHRGLRSAVLINAVIPAGTSVTVDLRDDSAVDGTGAAVAPGPLDHDAAPGPLLLFARPGIADLSRFDPSGPDHLLRWYRRSQLDGPGAVPRELGPRLPWAELVGLGVGAWNLQLSDHQPSRGRVDAALLRFRQSTVATAPAHIAMAWDGRRLGTFTLRLDTQHLSRAGDGELHYRRAWLHEQIERLKLAGTIYIKPEDTAAGQISPSPGDALADAPGHGEVGSLGGGTGGESDADTDTDSGSTPAPTPPPVLLRDGELVVNHLGRIAVGSGLERIALGDRLRWTRERERPSAPHSELGVSDTLDWRIVRRGTGD